MKAWVQSPAVRNPAVVVHTWNSNTQEVELGGSEVTGDPVQKVVKPMRENLLGIVVHRREGLADL